MKVLYESYKLVKLTKPYIPGFLAFREVNFLVDLVNQLRAQKPALVPQIIFVDGNGTLHTRGFGSACHFGVLAGLPTVGVAKNLMFVDGLSTDSVKQKFRDQCHRGGDAIPLIGDSGVCHGWALKSTDDSNNPIYISSGHRISQKLALDLSKSVCDYRIPEPVRQADLRSRNYIRKYYRPSK